jgi:5-methyltetrahydropteroyltriglutamate--homocysteine methyltransferase
VTTLLPTTVVGSYPQPAWLVDHEALRASGVPRVRAPRVWRVAAPWLEAAQDDATRLAIRDLELAGIDVVTDGEIRRESYFNRFATALEGLDLERPGTAMGRTGRPTAVPRVVGPLRRARSVMGSDAGFLRRHTDRAIKVTVPGPFTLSALAEDEHYGDVERLAMAYAEVVNEELRELRTAGVDVLQLDEPYLQAWPDRARQYGVAAIDRALVGVSGPTVVHLCFGYAYTVKNKPSGYSFLPELDRSAATHVSIEAAQPRLDLGVLERLPSKTVLVGVLDLEDPAVESPEVVAGRLREALRHLPRERVVAAPDCGMKYLSRDVAFGKLAAMVQAARRVREEIA